MSKTKIDKLIDKLGKIEDKLAERDKEIFKIREGSKQERILINQRLKIKDKIKKLM